MASIPGAQFHITGASGSQGLLAPRQSWRAYVFPRGGYAAQDSTGTLITFDSASVAARFAANNWIQVGLSIDNIRQVSAVGGNSISVSGAALTVSENDRVFLIGNTQPSTAGGSATYTVPATIIRQRDDDGADLYTNSMVTSNADGLVQFFSDPALYDVLIQDGNRTNQGSIIDLPVGAVEGVSTSVISTLGATTTVNAVLPATPYGTSIGTCTQPFGQLAIGGRITSGTTAASGATAHRFTTCTGWTQGNLFEFFNSGTVVYGDTWGGVYWSYTLPRVYNVKSARYGARGDSSTNDVAAIQAAIDDASTAENGSEGAIVYLPRGVYIVNSQLNVRNRVTMMGESKRGSVIRAGGSFPTNTVVVRLTDTGETAGIFDVRLERLLVDCNNIAGSIAVGSTQMQEGCGLFNVELTNFRSAGISLSTSGCQNWTMRGLEIFGNSGGAPGIDIDSNGSNNLLEDLTINGQTQSTAPAVRIVGSDVNIQRIHMELHNIGVHFSTSATGSLIGAYGHSTVDEVVRISNNGVKLVDIIANGATSTVNNTLEGTSTGTAISLLVYGQAGAVNQKGQLDDAGAFGQRFYGNVMHAGTSTGQLTPAGNSLTLPSGYFFGVSMAGTSITSINPTGTSFAGREVFLFRSAGTIGFSSPTNGSMRVEGGVLNLAANEAARGFCTGSTWFIARVV